ncbi:prostaglandin E2 receptor EP4 subtype-like [Protopterus annectens]|uniref:prostaglandin E2 receptor EP4 subtype-like n=1 Tax=Protopterus annectens TaxID=7888 RepID=UPI001CF96295|nr:prostaglandin E2 receptor EP4 subtype-like [Protopterus annectens]
MNISNNTNSSDGDSSLVVPLVMFLAGVIGNSIAIVVLCKSKKERKESAFYTLICGLAVTDLLGTCMASPVVLVNYLSDNIFESGLCQFHSFILLFFGVAGLCIICAMSVERYLSISQPYLYQKYISRKVAGWTLFSIYIGSVLLCALPSMGMSKSVIQLPKTWCFIDWKSNETLHAAYSFLYAGISSVLIMGTVVCNIMVCATLAFMYRGSRSRLIYTASRDRFTALASNITQVEIQMILLLIVTSVVVLICSIPLVFRIFANQLNSESATNSTDNQDLKAIRIASFNPILDPWVYILLRKSVFTKLIKIFKRIFSCAFIRCNHSEQSPDLPEAPSTNNETVFYLRSRQSCLMVLLPESAITEHNGTTSFKQRTLSFENEAHELDEEFKSPGKTEANCELKAVEMPCSSPVCSVTADLDCDVEKQTSVTTSISGHQRKTEDGYKLR